MDDSIAFYHKAIPQKLSTKCQGHIVQLLCLLLLTLPANANWLMDCGNCKCKWNSGKKTANCSHQSLSGVPENLSSELQVLDLSDNRLTYLDDKVFLLSNLQNLHKLYIRHSELRRINAECFLELGILIELDLSNNLLEELPTNVFKHLIKVRAVILNKNLLQSLGKGVFHNLKYLHKVELKDNRLMSVDTQAFRDVPLLSEIYLDANKLSYLHKASFDSLKRLTTLSLEQNPWNCTCDLKLFRDYIIKMNLYNPSTVCHYPLELRGMLWIEDQPKAFTCQPKIVYPVRGASINTYKENITLLCRVQASANTTVSWQFKNQLYTANSTAIHQRIHVHLHRDDWTSNQHFDGANYVSRLTIMGAGESDDGIYTCIASNIGGQDFAQMSLKVQQLKSPDFLLRSNLFIGICLVALGLLGISVLLSIVTCCIYRRLKQSCPSPQRESILPLQLAAASQDQSGSSNAPLDESGTFHLAVSGDSDILLNSENYVNCKNKQQHFKTIVRHHNYSASNFVLKPAETTQTEQPSSEVQHPVTQSGNQPPTKAIPLKHESKEMLHEQKDTLTVRNGVEDSNTIANETNKLNAIAKQNNRRTSATSLLLRLSPGNSRSKYNVNVREYLLSKYGNVTVSSKKSNKKRTVKRSKDFTCLKKEATNLLTSSQSLLLTECQARTAIQRASKSLRFPTAFR